MEQNQSKNNHAAFVVESSNQIKQADLENEEIIAEIQLLSTRLREKKEFLERSVQNRYFEYNEYCNNKFETCSDKNKEELKILERTLNKSLDRYLDNSAKRLFEFNAAVQADSKDLSTIPLDMKEYDQNPLKTVVYIPKGINSVHI